MKEIFSIQVLKAGKTATEIKPDEVKVKRTPIELNEESANVFAAEGHCADMIPSDFQFIQFIFPDNTEPALLNAQLSFQLTDNGEDMGRKTIRLSLAEATEIKKGIEAYRRDKNREK